MITAHRVRPPDPPSTLELLNVCARLPEGASINAEGICRHLGAGTPNGVSYRLRALHEAGLLLQTKVRGYYRLVRFVQYGELPSAEGRTRKIRVHSYDVNWGTYSNATGVWAKEDGKPPTVAAPTHLAPWNVEAWVPGCSLEFYWSPACV